MNLGGQLARHSGGQWSDIIHRDALSNILAGYVGRNTYKKGMDIEFEGIRGTIENISNIGITLKSTDGTRTIVPTKKLLNENVKIFNYVDPGL